MKTSLKKPAKNRNPIRLHFIIVYALIVGLLAAVGLLCCYTRTLWRNVNGDQSVIRSYIHDAVEGLYKPTVIDPKEKKQYVYETSVRFAIPAKMQTLRYTYWAAEGDFAENITLTTDSALRAGYNRLESPNIFDNVPQYQRCSKMYMIEFKAAASANTDGFTRIDAKQLADGRTAYLYKNQQCADFYKANSVDAPAFQQVVESIESY